MFAESAYLSEAQASTDLEIEFNGKIIPLYTFTQLQGLGQTALNKRLQLLKDTLEDSYELPPKVSNHAEVLVRHILTIQAIVVSHVKEIQLNDYNHLDIMERYFGAPESILQAERQRPTTPPRRKVQEVQGDNGPTRMNPSKGSVDSRKDFVPPAVICNRTWDQSRAAQAASDMEVTCNGKRVPLYSYEQLHHLHPNTLMIRARDLQDAVHWPLPQPHSRRVEDLLCYILCVQADIAAYQASQDGHDPVDPETLLVQTFKMPPELVKLQSCKRHLNARNFETQHADFTEGTFQQRRHFSDQTDQQEHMDSARIMLSSQEPQTNKQHFSGQNNEIDHFRGERLHDMDANDAAREGNLPRAIGHGKRRIEEQTNGKDDTNVMQHRTHIAPKDHMQGGYVANDIIKKTGGKHFDEFFRGNNMSSNNYGN